MIYTPKAACVSSVLPSQATRARMAQLQAELAGTSGMDNRPQATGQICHFPLVNSTMMQIKFSSEISSHRSTTMYINNHKHAACRTWLH